MTDREQIIADVKAKYRDEARKAVVSAEKTGFENGKTEGFQMAEEQIKKWKSIAGSLAQAPPLNDSPSPLLKYVLEQVFRDVKKAWSGENENSEIIQKFKTVLIESSVSLKDSLPEIVLIDRTKTSDSRSPGSSNVPLLNSNLRISLSRYSEFPRKYDILVNIPRFTECTKKGVLKDGSYISYCVEIKIQRSPSSLFSHFPPAKESMSTNNPIRSLEIERRHSEFQALYSVLRKEYPKCILPVLPTHPPTLPLPRGTTGAHASSMSSSTQFKNSSFFPRDLMANGEVKLEKRKRLLQLWLQCLLLHPRLQASPPVSHFLSTTNNNFLSNSREESNRSSVSSSDSPFSSTFSSHSPSNEDSSSSPSLSSSDKTVRWPAYQYVRRDLKQLSPNMSESMDALRNLSQSLEALFDAQKAFEASLIGVAKVESDFQREGAEGAMWGMLQTSVHTSLPSTLMLNKSIHEDLVEPFAFLSAEVIESAAVQTLERSRQTLSNSHLTSKEKEEEALGLAQEWVTCRKIRSQLLFDKVVQLAQSQAVAHKELTKHWVLSRKGMKRDQRANSIGDSPESSGLREAMASEAESLRTSLAHIPQDTFISAVQRKEATEDLFESKKTPRSESPASNNHPKHLKHHTLTRPILPTGTRKPSSNIFSSFFDKVNPFSPSHSSPTSTSSKSQQPTQPTRREGPPERVDPEERTHHQNQSKRPSTTPSSSTPPTPTNHSDPNFLSFFSPNSKSDPHKDEEEEDEDEFEEFLDRDPRVLYTPQTEVEEEDTPMNRLYKKQQQQQLERQRQEQRKQEEDAQKRKNKSGTGTGVLTFEEEKERRKRAQRAAASGNSSRRPQQTQQHSTSEDVFGSSPRPAASFTKNQQSPSPSTPQPIPPDSPVHSSEDASSQPPQNYQTNITHTASPPPSQTPDLPEEPLPDGWEQVQSEEGVYYYHRVTRLSRWDRPTVEVAAALEARLNESQSRVEEAVQRRKEERQQQQREEQKRQEASQSVQSLVKDLLLSWKFPRGKDKPSAPLWELLNTVHTVTTLLPLSSSQPLLSAESTSGEIKKVYLKAVRVLHPDKLPSSLDLETKVMAESVFVILSESYEALKQ